MHGVCGVWGLLATGIFARKDVISEGFSFNEYDGLLYGDSYLLGVQALAAVSFAVWAVVSTFIIIRTIDFILPLRAGSCQLLTILYTEIKILKTW